MMQNCLIELLSKRHDRASFSCRIESLDLYLKRYASQDVKRNMAQVYITAEPGAPAVTGYYSLSAAGFEPGAMPANAARGLPPYEQYPALLLGRLAVDARFQGRKLGHFMMMDAFSRALHIAESTGVHSLTVEPLDGSAAAFYARYGFQSFLEAQEPASLRRMFLPMSLIKKAC